MKKSESRRIIETAFKIAATPTIRIIRGNLFLQGKLLNKIQQKVPEIYQQYVTDPDKYNPSAKFPEEVNSKEFTDETFFPLLFLNVNPFKMVIGLKMEEIEIHLGIDCAPATPRPNSYLEKVMEGTGITIKHPEDNISHLFGAFQWKTNVIKDQWTKKTYDLIFERLRILHSRGNIRGAFLAPKVESTATKIEIQDG